MTAYVPPKVVAILNVTPDSFSDGGMFTSTSEAVDRGIQLRDQGADIVDVGGESTRPGAERVPESEELTRVIPVVKKLVAAGVVVSVDTMNSATAREAADAGATFINDVSGGGADSGMYATIARTGILYIAVHGRGPSADMQQRAQYGDVVKDVRSELKGRLAQMVVSGIDLERVILDPGLGFAKEAQHNWQLLAGLDRLGSLGRPLLVGASRKRFLAEFSPDEADPSARDGATAIVTAMAARSGVWGVRVHDVPSTRVAIGVVTAWSDANPSNPATAEGRLR